MILTTGNLTEIRRRVAEGENPSWNKQQINLTIQTIEDWFENNKLNLLQIIDNSGFSFTNSQKKKLISYWLINKFNREK